MGLKNKDLEPIIGTKGHVSAILSGKREITLKMAQKLKTFFGIPAAVFFYIRKPLQMYIFLLFLNFSENIGQV